MPSEATEIKKYMRILKVQNSIKFFANFKFAMVILALIAIGSSLGSFIEQDQDITYYQETYPEKTPIYGFINWKFIINFGLDSVYSTWWFLTLLFILAISLITCSFIRQIPLLRISKEYFFKRKKNSFKSLPFSVKFPNVYFLKELILLKIEDMNFYIYQTNKLIYGYKGLIGRISPILVHISLVLILLGSSIGAFKNFKAQEILPKGELFHIQNPIKIGSLTSLPNITTRVNDFWVEYENNRIHQFYSSLSILDEYGNELKTQTISVNNPLRYKNIDFYQSDWNLLGIRIKKINENRVYEFPVFSIKKSSKNWISWIKNNNEDYTIIINKLENNFLIYDKNGNYIDIKNINDTIDKNLLFLDVLPSTGLLIKYDPSIPIIYLGFALLMITTFLSYLPYTQIWLFTQKKTCWLGGNTNRGKIQGEIQFENLIRYIENLILKRKFIQK